MCGGTHYDCHKNWRLPCFFLSEESARALNSPTIFSIFAQHFRKGAGCSFWSCPVDGVVIRARYSMLVHLFRNLFMGVCLPPPPPPLRPRLSHETLHFLCCMVLTRILGRYRYPPPAPPAPPPPFTWTIYMWCWCLAEKPEQELELLDSPGIIPARQEDQNQALKLAICNDIGEASYDSQVRPTTGF